MKTLTQSFLKVILLQLSFFIFNVEDIHAQHQLNRDSLFRVINSASTHDTLKAKIYNSFARSYTSNHPDSVIYYAKKGYAVVKSDKLWKSNMLNTIGVGFYLNSEFDSALHYYSKTLELREKLGNDLMISTTINNLAIIHQIQGNHKKALELFLRSLKYKEKANDLPGICKVIDNISILFNEQRDGRSALRYQNRVLRILQEVKDTGSIAQLYVNMSVSYKNLGQLDSVKYLLEKSIPILIKSNNNKVLADAYNNLGMYYGKLKKNEESIVYFEKAKKLYAEIGNPMNIAAAEMNIGISYLQLENFKVANAMCKSALEVFEQSGNHESIIYCLNCLYRSSKGLKKHEDALKYYERHDLMEDSVMNRQRTRELTQLEMNHEFNKKTEIADLQHQKDLEIKEQEKKTQKIIIVFSVLGLILAVFLIVFIINRLQLSKKQNRIIELQKKDVEEQKHIIEEKQKEILDSIHYAKRIQTALLAHKEFIDQNIPGNFVYFNPKDIVSGDFYWATKHGDLFFLAVCDSTGHGVPGAFMSLLNIGFMSEAINEKDIIEPNKVFNYVRKRLIDSISKDGQKDGFDGILLCINLSNKKMTYAAAHNAPVIAGPAGLRSLETDKMPVGMGIHENEFRLFDLELRSGETLYLYTDGYADQFGGPKGKKFKYKQLNDLIVSLHEKEMSVQMESLKTEFENWRGELEQVDDVCVIGIRM